MRQGCPCPPRTRPRRLPKPEQTGVSLHLIRSLITTTLALGTLGAIGLAQAQATVKNDGQRRASFGLGACLSAGNSQPSKLSMTGDAVRATDLNKTTLYGNAQYARSGEETTAEQLRLGGRYDHNLNLQLFAFGGLDLERNKFANLQLRSLLSGGLGYHALKTPSTTSDLLGGLGYTSDHCIDPMVIDAQNRSQKI